MKTNEIIGKALDYAVAKIEYPDAEIMLDFEGFVAMVLFRSSEMGRPHLNVRRLNYSTDWALGGPIRDREKISLMHHDDGDVSAIAFRRQVHSIQAQTALIAIMRCYVTLHHGADIEIPKEFLGEQQC